MSTSKKENLKAFYCYAREDLPFLEQLEKHLSGLKRTYHLKTWFDRAVLPGVDWEKAITTNLNLADIIFLLISPAFMDSNYCYNAEMLRALKRHEQDEIRIIPILVRPVYWKNAPFSNLQMLPTDARPVTNWPNTDDAFYDITLGIEKVIEDLLLTRKPGENTVRGVPATQADQETLQAEKDLPSEEIASHYKNQIEETDDIHKISRSASNRIFQLIAQGNIFHQLGKYEEAIKVYMQAIDQDLHTIMKGPYKGDADTDLQKAEEALVLTPHSVAAYRDKIVALLELQRYEEVLLACEQIMRPNYYVIAVDYNNKAYALNALKRHEESLQACEQALRLKPRLAAAHKNRAYALNGLKRYEEALQACQQALYAKPDLSAAYAIMGFALFHLKRGPEASSAFAQWSRYLSQDANEH